MRDPDDDPSGTSASRISPSSAIASSVSPPDEGSPDHAGPGSGSTVDEPTTGNRFVSGLLLAAFGTFLFALKSIFIKLAFQAGAGPTLLLTLRMLMALPFYVFVLWRLWPIEVEGSRPSRGLIGRALALGFLGYYLASYLDLCGLAYISAQMERLTLFVYPAIIAILAAMFLGERLTIRVALAIALCWMGVLVMYWRERELLEGSNVGRGVALVACSALSYSLYVLFAKPTMLQMGSRQFTSLAMIGSTVFVAGHFAATRPPTELVSAAPSVYAIGLVLAFVCTVLPSFMISEAIVRIGATRTSVIGSVG
ncbi:MAG: DMT family transporter, partial [Planctomycetota bacterium]